MPLTLQPGDALPDFLLPSENGVSRFFYESCCGKATVLLLAKNIAAVAHLHPTDTFNLVVVLGSERHGDKPAWPVLDNAASLCLRLSGHEQPDLLALVLGPDLRLVTTLQAPGQAELVAEIDRLPKRRDSQLISATAPVLMIPEVINTDIAQALLRCWQQNHSPSGMPRRQGTERVLMPDQTYKSRLDHSLQDKTLVAALNSALQQRILPVMARSFHYLPTRTEGFKIVAYPADQAGHFAAHRDNISPETRHRHFALSLNLNDDYEGGELVFPEFSDDRYRPPAGAALVFSGSLLHKVQPVSRGCRYVALSFLWQ
ncbi:MAG: hypothetical protein CVV07_06935 [Gammaproteobacteria bacterium HGW-Gammaproteobacteria-11]|nr:MAG: hypothetical protein CVV07_06935 [Gammaproteobacteria bacterium HGW-Gammaproteobacteria-11]